MLPQLTLLSNLVCLPLLVNATLLRRIDGTTAVTSPTPSPSPSPSPSSTASADPQHDASDHDHDPTYHAKQISDHWALFVACIIGGIAFLCALVGLVWFLWRRHVRGKRRFVGNLMGLGLRRDQLDKRGKFVKVEEQQVGSCEDLQGGKSADEQEGTELHKLMEEPRTERSGKMERSEVGWEEVERARGVENHG